MNTAPKPEKRYIYGKDGLKIPLHDKEKFKSIFDELGKDTIEAIDTLKALGGVSDLSKLTKLPEPRKCCCFGTPIGDRLLELAADLDYGGNSLLAQTGSHSHYSHDSHDSYDETHLHS